MIRPKLLSDGYNFSICEYPECARVIVCGGRENSAFFVVNACTNDREIHSNISHNEKKIAILVATAQGLHGSWNHT